MCPQAQVKSRSLAGINRPPRSTRVVDRRWLTPLGPIDLPRHSDQFVIEVDVNLHHIQLCSS